MTASASVYVIAIEPALLASHMPLQFTTSVLKLPGGDIRGLVLAWELMQEQEMDVALDVTWDRLFDAPTHTLSSGCFMFHMTVHTLWNLCGNPYKNRPGKEEAVKWRGNS